jgi:hypothetical protein
MKFEDSTFITNILIDTKYNLRSPDDVLFHAYANQHFIKKRTIYTTY